MVETEDDQAKPVPKNGDFNLCSTCGTFLVYTETEDGLDVRLASDEELAMLKRETLADQYRLYEALQARFRHRHHHGG